MPDDLIEPENAYLDATRFPVTTQVRHPGDPRGSLSLKDQKMLDAINWDDLKQKQQSGRQMTDKDIVALREFEEKAKLR
jgi:hypothetical protein